MSERRNTLTPPVRAGTGDPGAHELDASDSDEHFSDAQSGPATPQKGNQSPIPKLRVEKVSAEPSYGEVPGTDAYKKREADFTPDEIAVIPDRQGVSKEDLALDPSFRPQRPGGHPIPKTMVEETVDEAGSTTHPDVERRHQDDPSPDLVVKADGSRVEDENDGGASDPPLSPALSSPVSSRAKRKEAMGSEEEDTDEAFGDDFDDFTEGGEEGDFGDFDDGFEAPESQQQPPKSPAPSSIPPPQQLPFPIPDFDGLDLDDILTTTSPYLRALYPAPSAEAPPLPPIPKDNPVFLTPRSASLWSQLVAPPPLQPPDWIRSRIRRWFLVSLGVPVDLDEILPASKQKKLVLPSLHKVTSSGSLRSSFDSRSVARLKQGEGNASSTSVDSQGKPKASISSAGPSQRKRAGPPEPVLDLVAARQLCMTTEEALNGMTDAELRTHVKKLDGLEATATEVLEYWTKRTDEKVGDRDAFEGVIENLVKHARKTRK